MNAIAHLFEVYVKINADLKPEEDAYKAAKEKKEDTSGLEKVGLLGESKEYFKRMEEGDEEALALWARFRDLSIEKYKENYARLNIEFAEYSGESKVKQETMDEAEKILAEKDAANTSFAIIDVRDNGTQTPDKTRCSRVPVSP